MRMLTVLILVLFTISVRAQSFEETQRPAEQGNASAQVELGKMYANGEGAPQDDDEAVLIEKTTDWFWLVIGGGLLALVVFGYFPNLELSSSLAFINIILIGILFTLILSLVRWGEFP